MSQPPYTDSTLTLEAALGSIGLHLGLSPREGELLRLFAAGVLATKDLCRYFSISAGTADKHVENICRKAEVSGRYNLLTVFLALEKHLVRCLEELVLHGKTKPKLMVIEDEPIIAEAIAAIFVKTGFDAVDFAGKPRELQAAVSDFEPAVVVFDYFYPSPIVRSAILGAIPGRNPVAPVRVLITGYPENLVAPAQQNVPILYKPIDLRDLVRVALKAYLEYQGRMYLEKNKSA